MDTLRAWVLMTNDIHLLFKSGTNGISAMMRKQLTWYAQYYNRCHNKDRSSLPGRYKTIFVDRDRGTFTKSAHQIL